MPTPPVRNTEDTGDTPGSKPRGKSLGMGGEAVEAVHAAQQKDTGRPPNPTVESQQNEAATGAEGGVRAGSEPLEGREWTHVPGYGGRAGAPRTSSNEREPDDPGGNLDVGDTDAGGGRPA